MSHLLCCTSATFHLGVLYLLTMEVFQNFLAFPDLDQKSHLIKYQIGLSMHALKAWPGYERGLYWASLVAKEGTRIPM